MPRRRIHKKRTTRRKKPSSTKKWMKKFRGKRPTHSIVKSPSLIPDRMFVRLKYCSGNTYILGTSTTSLQTNTISELWRLNSIYQPDLGVGHAPLGKDQYVALYNLMRVHSSQISIRIMSVSNNDTRATVVVRPTSTFTPFNLPYQNWREQPYTRFVDYVPTTHTKVLRSRMSVRKLSGVSTIQDCTEYTQTATTDPNQLFYWNLFCFTNDGTTTARIQAEVTIIYNVEFFSRKTLASSSNP